MASSNTMHAAWLTQPGCIAVRELAVPLPRAGEIVIRVEEALTCGTDLKAFRRGHPFIPMPGPFGHQYSGRIESVGAGIRGLEVGQPIWGVHSAPCRDCHHCHRGHFSLCIRLTDQLVLGAFAQFLRIPPRVAEQNIMPRPATASPRRAAFLEPTSCVVHALQSMSWQGVNRVLIIGLGSMGLLFAQVLPEFTKASVVGVGRNRLRLGLARSYGLEMVLDADAGELRDQLGPRDRGFDVVIECTGRHEGWTTAFDAVLPGGQVQLFGGLPKGTSFAIDTYRMHYEEISLRGSFHFGPPDVRRAAELLSNGRLRVEEMVSGVLPLTRIEWGLEQMAAGKAIKFAVDPWLSEAGMQEGI